ncbi:MAG: glycosyltransferase [Spirochaetales bacterium]|nr:glycosyltransferase [Spirochaetales bacterium]
MTGTDFNPCAVIPVYNHGSTAGGVVGALRASGLPVILVDDGSDAATKRILQEIAEHTEGCRLFTLPRNLGKGGAVSRGLEEAFNAGFTHALQADADGQHDLGRAGDFIEQARSSPEALVGGRPVFDSSVPASRLSGRRITTFWVRIETLSRDIPDAMCGFRVYPLKACHRLLAGRSLRRRMEFDIEILVRLYWRRVPMVFLPLAVTYPAGGVSHFRLFRDNLAIGLMHACLFFEMLARAPGILVRRFTRRILGGAERGGNGHGALV